MGAKRWNVPTNLKTSVRDTPIGYLQSMSKNSITASHINALQPNPGSVGYSGTNGLRNKRFDFIKNIPVSYYHSTAVQFDKRRICTGLVV